MYFEFNQEQFEHFKSYVLAVDCLYWECMYENANFKRKIPIPSMQENLVLMFNRQEMAELKSLLRFEENKTLNLLKADDIDYRYILN